jgi:hypothetical protein
MRIEADINVNVTDGYLLKPRASARYFDEHRGIWKEARDAFTIIAPDILQDIDLFVSHTDSDDWNITEASIGGSFDRKGARGNSIQKVVQKALGVFNDLGIDHVREVIKRVASA